MDSCRRHRIAIVLLFAVLVRNVADLTGHAAKLEDAIENAEVIRTFPIAGASIGRFRTGFDAIAIHFEEHDSSIVAAYDFSGELLFRHSRPGTGRPMLRINDISDDGSTFLITEDVGYYDLRRFAVDRDGEELCELPIEGGIRVSPGGQYFCPVYDDMTRPRFGIYDRTGTRIEYSGPSRSAWNAAFLDDSIVLLADMNDLRLVATNTGRVISTSPFTLRDRTSEYPDIAVSKADSLAIVYDEHRMQALSFRGEALWSGGTCATSAWVVPREQGGWFAEGCQIWGDPGGYISIVEAQGSRSVARTEYIPDPRIWFPRGGCEVSWFTDGILLTWYPGAWGSWTKDSHDSYLTLFNEFDPQSETTDSAFTERGLYRPVHGPGIAKHTFVRILPPDTVQIVCLNRP